MKYLICIFKYFICIFWLAYNKKRQTSKALLDIPPKAAHAVYSVNIASAQGENSKILVSNIFNMQVLKWANIFKDHLGPWS